MLYLCIGEPQAVCDLVTVCRREVLLVQEALLQLVDLLVGEGRARLAPFLGRRVLAEQRRLVASPGVCNRECDASNDGQGPQGRGRGGRGLVRALITRFGWAPLQENS